MNQSGISPGSPGSDRRPGATEGPGPLSALERKVVARILQGSADGLATLRDQLAGATMVSRTYSGVGLVTRIAIPDGLPAVPADVSLRLRPALATHPQLSEAAEFLLQVRDGRLAVLEAYCFQGGWPAVEQAFRMVD
ncbi:MAG: hypothetical protein R3F24_00135 [Gammaproteobacteria bacterium]